MNDLCDHRTAMASEYIVGRMLYGVWRAPGRNRLATHIAEDRMKLSRSLSTAFCYREIQMFLLKYRFA